MSERPLLAITMGDPAGVGPEVTVKALAEDNALYTLSRPLVIGDAGVLREAAGAAGLDVRIRPLADPQRPAEGAYDGAGVDVLDLANVDPADWAWGRLSAGSGRAAMAYIERAMALTDAGITAAIVTAPINKEATTLAGYHELGHMELFAKKYNAQNQ